MTEKELQDYLLKLYPKEDGACEWKEMKNLKNSFANQPHEDVISYVSAIANMDGGHLIIGVVDQTLEIVGTDLSRVSFNGSKATPQSATLNLIDKCTNLSSEKLSIDEFVTDDTLKTVWVVNIPKHLPRRPVYAHKTAWQRIEDSIVPMTEERLNAILSEQIAGDDWSATVIPEATIDDLDPDAIRFAKSKYLEIHPQKAKEAEGWDDITFLNKAKLTIKGKITVTAIILVGREESEHFLSPAVCKIRWTLKDKHDSNKDFGIFSIPMIKAVEDVTNKIRNVSYVYTIEGSMFPENMKRYDVFTLREPLNNAIAHQDYTKGARIEIVEYEDESLMFRNYGQFIPESVESVINNNWPESVYRNPFLVEAMRNVNMIETEGGGIRKLFMQQKKRFFPMPEYDISGGKVVCEIQGKVFDETFAKILVNNPDLSLPEIILLDKVQKRIPLADDAINLLRSKKFVEGRKGSLYLSFKVVAGTKHIGLKASYIKNKSFDDSYYKGLIIRFITEFGRASRKDIEELLMGKLPDVLDDKQKYDKITNFLASLRRDGKIYVIHKMWMLK